MRSVSEAGEVPGKSSTGDFYDRLPAVDSFSAGLGGMSAPVPDDWYVVMTDVVSSMKAIESGKYKTVNIAGSLPIIAIARVIGTLRRPFVFGGDGMTFLVGPEHIAEVRRVLARVVRDIGNLYDLEVRAVSIPVKLLYRDGGAISVSKVKVSDQYYQAFLRGSGVKLAEDLMKSVSPEAASFRIPVAEDQESVNYEGFTCRWADVPSATGITAALIVEPRESGDPAAIMASIEEILGSDESYHPLRVESMRMGGGDSTWREPFRVNSGGRKNLRYRIGTFFESIMIFMIRLVYALKIPIRSGINEVWRVKEQNIENSDFRKYEEAIKMIISLERDQLTRLRDMLETARQAGSLYFGIHESDKAHLTCIATVETGDDVHFVDAADGGYALAAKELKAQKMA
jgi:hypothetical protein